MVRILPPVKMAVFGAADLLRASCEVARFAMERANRFVRPLQPPTDGIRSIPGVTGLFGLCSRARSGWIGSSLYRQLILSQYPQLLRHPQWSQLFDVVTGETYLDSSGFPLISRESFSLFKNEVPHLFQEGDRLLGWLDQLDRILGIRSDLPSGARESMQRASQVLRRMVSTAGITAPSDLWVLRHLLSFHQRLGTLKYLARGFVLNVENFARERGLDPVGLSRDLRFFYSRGYLDRTDDGFVASPQMARVLEAAEEIPKEFLIDRVGEIRDWFQEKTDPARESKIRRWLCLRQVSVPGDGWSPGLREVDIGYHLVPLMIALKAAGLTEKLKEGVRIQEQLPRLMPEMKESLEEAGLVRDGRVTALGARVFKEGPGAMGIIGAYHSYWGPYESFLRGGVEKPNVARGPNIAASEVANRKSLRGAVDALKRYRDETGFRPTAFVEHAMGKGIGIQEFCEVFGEEGFELVGADFESTPLEEARRGKEAGRLPKKLKLVQADIGHPETLIDFLRAEGIEPRGAVMVVSAGFHEIRNQTNTHMVEIFEAYRKAGIILIFIEESALSDDQVREAAWETYHAGFAFVHRLSGQGLRPAWQYDEASELLSWTGIAEQAGYEALEQYEVRKRNVFPFPAPRGQSPSINVTFFCIPSDLRAVA